MNSAIEQTLAFKNTTPEELFDIFLDPDKHSQILGGAAVKISKKEGIIFFMMEYFRLKNFV